MAKLDIEYLINVDDTGMPKAPNIKQILDKDIMLLFTRDKSKDKSMYIKEVGVVYQLGDPNSIFKQEGLSDKEIIKKCIEYYDLPSTYQPDLLVLKLAKRYYNQRITPAGIALEALQKAMHNETIIINRINEMINDKLNSDLSVEDINTFIGLAKQLNDKAKDIPELSKSIQEAYDNLLYEREAKSQRGGDSVLSSMTEEDL